MRLAYVAAAVIVLGLLATPAFAHRLDEYLQATTIGVEANRVAVQMRLTPGVEVFRAVIANIDSDGDGIVSPAERGAYAQRILGDLSLTIDGGRVPLRVVSATFPKVEEMREGLGDIVLQLEADVPRGGASRKLVFENRHQRGISVYLVNCLVPNDPAIRIAGQSRDFEQTVYQLDYTQAVTAGSVAAASAFSPSGRANWGSLFAGYFYHGVRHILTGYDHLLFVGALVLAATTLWDLVKVVSAFTLAHTITLTLAALNVVHVSERIVEPLIAGSIVFVALQNVLWPSRARGWSRLGAAFFFGLFHGLGFAGGLLNAMREMPGATMLLAIVAFSIGVETGHQLVVLPLFMLLKSARRTRHDDETRIRYWMALQRIGSAGISVAGAYYLCVAFIGRW